MPTPQPNKNKPEEREVQDVQRHNPKQHIQMILREALSNLPTSRRTSLCIATSRASMWLSTARRRALGSYWAVWSHTLPSIGLKQLKQNTANRECMRWQNRLGRIVWGMHALVDVHSLCQNAHCTQKRAIQVESSFSKMPHSYRLFFHSCVPALFQSWICLLVLLLLLSDGLQLSLSQIWPYLPSLHEIKTRSNWWPGLTKCQKKAHSDEVIKELVPSFPTGTTFHSTLASSRLFFSACKQDGPSCRIG